jgi:hypothetical protein
MMREDVNHDNVDQENRDNVDQEWGPEAARWYVLAWIDQNLPAPSSPLSASQLHELMYEVAILAVNENLRTHGDATQLAADLNTANKILLDLQVGTNRRGDVSEKTNEEVDADRLMVWHRRDVRDVLQFGRNSRDYYCIQNELILHAASAYLSMPWMRHPTIDWILVDAIITGETILCGEKLKKALYNGASGVIYSATKGNLEEMKRRSRDELRSAHRSNIPYASTIWYGVLPIALIFATFYFRYLIVGAILGEFYALFLIWRWMRRQIKSDEQSWFELWAALRDIWRLLAPPTVNPGTVREALDSAARKGIIVAQTAHAIVDDRLRANPTTWVVDLGDQRMLDQIEARP